MALQSTPALEELNQRIAETAMRGQWLSDEKLEASVGGQKGMAVPHLWRWDETEDLLMQACSALPDAFTARRAIGASNPGLMMGATRTMASSIQMVRPGESAWAHRHSITALRFVMQGAPGVRTVVDGEDCPMLDNDLVLTPNWAWHDHHNESDTDAVWLDVLDAPFVMTLDQTFYETLGETSQPVRGSEAEFTRARTGHVRPAWEAPQTERLPMRYAWADTEPRLMAMRGLAGSPYDGIALEYINPMTGGPALKTLSCWIQLLRPGEKTKPHRHTSSAVYLGVRGRGRIMIEGTPFDWGPRDLIALPNWLEHAHENLSGEEDAILFSVNDAPIMQAHGLYREEPELSFRASPPPSVPV